MIGMEDAVDRILSAISMGEEIVVYGDYDVDGVTATALLSRCSNKWGESPHTSPTVLMKGTG